MTTVPTCVSTSYRQPITWNGYSVDVIKSGLQKYIRRGECEKALYCAGELDLFKHVEFGKSLHTNFLHRLMVIFLEDVADVSLLTFADHALTVSTSESHLATLIEQMCAAPKARICSHLRAVFNPAYKPLHRFYPTIERLWEGLTFSSLTIHCAEFKRLFEEGDIRCLFHGFQIHMSEERLAKPIYRSKKPVQFIFHTLRDCPHVAIFRRWFAEHMGSLRESFLCWMTPLLIALGVLQVSSRPAVSLSGSGSDSWERNRAGERIQLDPYVADMHTGEGRRKGVGKVAFAIEGALVIPDASWVHPVWKRFYEDGKRYEEDECILGPPRITPVAAPQVATHVAPLGIRIRSI